MAKFEVVMPKLGESVIEATITRWLKDVGEMIEEDESICELATDKVDSEIPSPVEGKLVQRLFEEGDVVPVGTIIAIIEMEGEAGADDEDIKPVPAKSDENTPVATPDIAVEKDTSAASTDFSGSDRFYSPLVKSIAKAENMDITELDKVAGSGKDGRVTKKDILAYLENRTKPSVAHSAKQPAITPPAISFGEGDTVVEMDRMRKLIADHMVMSKQTSPHVTSFIEVDMTRVVSWRNRVKKQFQEKHGEKLTFTPIFFEAAAIALRDFPGVNASVDAYNIIYRKNVNIGMATALPSGNLIVPVIKDADKKNLAGLAHDVNDLANRARQNQLKPDEIAGGTFTITNFGTFGSLSGTPIINQPQVAILAVGVISKKPAVIETPEGDMIGIRHKMILSMAYDHRAVDGALGGMYIQRIAQYLEDWDINRAV